jgi:hypothetical protein
MLIFQPRSLQLLAASLFFLFQPACGEDDKNDNSAAPASSPPASPPPSGGGGGAGNTDTPTPAPDDEACGDTDQACCADDTCNTWRQVCVAGTCEACGAEGGVCCTDPERAPCLGVNACSPDGTCQPCGELGQGCCFDLDDKLNDVCSIGTVCDPSVVECVECGATGGFCCEYGACDDDTATCNGYEEDVSTGTCE